MVSVHASPTGSDPGANGTGVVSVRTEGGQCHTTLPTPLPWALTLVPMGRRGQCQDGVVSVGTEVVSVTPSCPRQLQQTLNLVGQGWSVGTLALVGVQWDRVVSWLPGTGVQWDRSGQCPHPSLQP